MRRRPIAGHDPRGLRQWECRHVRTLHCVGTAGDLLCRYFASQFGNATIETDAIESEYLLLGLIREDKDLSTRILRIQAPVERIRKEIEARLETRETAVSASVDLPLSHGCMRMLGYAAREADRPQHRDIGAGHLLLGIFSEETSLAASILADILTGQGIGLDEVRADVVRFMNEESTCPPPPPRHQ